MTQDGNIPEDVETLVLSPSDGIPNHPHWSVVIYRRVWPDAGDPAEMIEQTFQRHGWRGCWRWSVFDFHHFHSNAHEALGVVRGEADLLLGGAGGQTVHVRSGDLLILPAGTGHKKESASSGFLVVGAYPRGQEDYDLRRGDPSEWEEVVGNIGRVPTPSTDPAFGDEGPLKRLWA